MWIRKNNSQIEVAPATKTICKSVGGVPHRTTIFGFDRNVDYLQLLGYVEYSGSLPLAYLDIVGGVVVEDVERYEADQSAALSSAVKRYSKLKLFDAVGAETWAQIVAGLTTEQQTRLELANELATDDAGFAEALASFSATVPNAAAILAGAEVL